jgi:hypothetical protein
VLDDRDDCIGWWEQGVVAVCCWEHDLWWELADDRWVTEHRSILVRLGVERRAHTDTEALDRYWEGCLDRGGPSRGASATTPVSCGAPRSVLGSLKDVAEIERGKR